MMIYFDTALIKYVRDAFKYAFRYWHRTKTEISNDKNVILRGQNETIGYVITDQ